MFEQVRFGKETFCVLLEIQLFGAHPIGRKGQSEFLVYHDSPKLKANKKMESSLMLYNCPIANKANTWGVLTGLCHNGRQWQNPRNIYGARQHL